MLFVHKEIPQMSMAELENESGSLLANVFLKGSLHYILEAGA